MDNDQIDALKYPIGKYKKPETIDIGMIQLWIETIESFPEKVMLEVKNLIKADLETAYRPGGWTIRQVIHHCADSHMNSFIRFKLALTEDNPVIKPYREDKWAMLPDANAAPINSSLLLLESLHQRWAILLKSLSPTDFEKSFIHPETKRELKLNEVLGLYAWHCNHHLEHIKLAKKNLHKK